METLIGILAIIGALSIIVSAALYIAAVRFYGRDQDE